MILTMELVDDAAGRGAMVAGIGWGDQAKICSIISAAAASIISLHVGELLLLLQ